MIRDADSKKLAAIAVNLLLLSLLFASIIIPVAGQNETYYNNSTSVNNQTWLEGDSEPTAKNTTSLIGRVGTFIVGSGGTSGLGALLTSLITGGIIVSMIGYNRVGMVGGATTGVMTLGGMTVAGLAPGWMWALVVFGVGLILTQVLIGILR